MTKINIDLKKLRKIKFSKFITKPDGVSIEQFEIELMYLTPMGVWKID